MKIYYFNMFFNTALEIKTIHLNYIFFSIGKVHDWSKTKKINFGDLEIVTRTDIFEYTLRKICHWGWFCAEVYHLDTNISTLETKRYNNEILLYLYP